MQHVFGGHEVTSSDLKLLFGSTLGPSVGNANVKALYVWLKANKRSEMHFQPSKFDFLELSLQRIYAMWPSLSIKLSSLDMPSHVEGREGQQEEGEERHSQCEISLHWQSKSQVHRDFQYPEKYRPNINKI